MNSSPRLKARWPSETWSPNTISVTIASRKQTIDSVPCCFQWIVERIGPNPLGGGYHAPWRACAESSPCRFDSHFPFPGITAVDLKPDSGLETRRVSLARVVLF